MIGNLSKDFIWHTINIHSKFTCRYHYTVDKFLAVAVWPINIHVIILLFIVICVKTLFGANMYGLNV